MHRILPFSMQFLSSCEPCVGSKVREHKGLGRPTPKFAAGTVPAVHIRSESAPIASRHSRRSDKEATAFVSLYFYLNKFQGPVP